MKHIIFMILVTLFSYNLCAQKEEKLDPIWLKPLEEKFEEARKTKSKTPLEEFYKMQDSSVINDSEFKSYYFKAKGEFFELVSMKSLMGLEKEDILKDTSLREYVEDMAIVMQNCGDCLVCSLKSKYETYDDLDILEYYPSTAKDALFDAGYKKKREGFGLGANYIYSGKPYYGLELMFNSRYIPSYSLKVVDSKTGKRERMCGERFSSMFTLLTLGLNYNPSENKTQAIFSILSAKNFLVAKLFQCGIEFTDKENVFFYRPELGIGHNGFHISAGYNVVMKDSLRSYVDKWVWSAGYSYVFNTL